MLDERITDLSFPLRHLLGNFRKEQLIVELGFTILKVQSIGQLRYIMG